MDTLNDRKKNPENLSNFYLGHELDIGFRGDFVVSNDRKSRQIAFQQAFEGQPHLRAA